MVRQTPRIGLSYCYIVDYKRKSGVSGFRLFASLGPRKTCTNEQNRIDTHAVGIYSTPVKACLKAWLAFGTPNGTVIYLPAAPTSAMSLTYAFEFPLKSATYRVSWEFTCKTTKILLLYIFLGHNRNVVNTKFPYPIKRLEVIRWFNQKSMVFNQSLS